MDAIDMATGEVTEGRMPAEIAAAIIAIKKQVKQLGTNEKNEHGRYNFVSVDKFYAVIGKMMAEAGLALLINEASAEVKASDKSGNPWLFVQYDLVFMHESGALSRALHRSCALPISGPQAYGAAQSYIEKQFLRQIFKVPTGDKDADDTKQEDGTAPAGGSGARTAQGSPAGTWAPPARQQAAPASSDAQADARRRWGQIRDEIDASITLKDLESLDGCPAWQMLDKLCHETDPADVADGAMQKLRDRIAKRREMILKGEGQYQ